MLGIASAAALQATEDEKLIIAAEEAVAGEEDIVEVSALVKGAIERLTDPRPSRIILR